ncbi:hypothetical protein EWM64_g8250, partial [Hericium alpestre]
HMSTSSVRVIVRLPYNRPEQPHPDPPPVEWNADKENYLWDVIARSRAADSAVPDWKALAARLGVPLPYLLYRAQTRYEQDLRGLQDIRGALSPSGTHAQPKSPDLEAESSDRPSVLRRDTSRLGNAVKLSSSIRLTTPLGVRARLNSLGGHSATRMNKVSSSSVITLQGHRRDHGAYHRPSSASSASHSDSEDETEQTEDAERQAEEEQTLNNKLKALEKMMTDDTLGLVSSVRDARKGKDAERGRHGALSPNSRADIPDGLRQDTLSRSQSVSSMSSPQGSIPSMPSPPPESQSSMGRHLSPPGGSNGPPSVSPRSGKGPQMRYVVKTRASDKGSSTQGSSASSFSDISDAGLSVSALESALMSDTRGGSSRL